LVKNVYREDAGGIGGQRRLGKIEMKSEKSRRALKNRDELKKITADSKKIEMKSEKSRRTLKTGNELGKNIGRLENNRTK